MTPRLVSTLDVGRSSFGRRGDLQVSACHAKAIGVGGWLGVSDFSGVGVRLGTVRLSCQMRDEVLDNSDLKLR